MQTAETRRGLGFVTCLLAFGSLLSPNGAPRLVAAAPPQEQAKEIVLRVDASHSKVGWTLGSTLHTVHGTFVVKDGLLRIDLATGKAGGEIVIDATSGASGNQGRDRKMHGEIIESVKYKEIAFRPDRINGKVPTQGSVTAQIHGMFLLHGGEHEITVPVQAELSADRWKGTAKLNVPYIAWGLKSPSNFFLKADKSVDVELELAGTVQR